MFNAEGQPRDPTLTKRLHMLGTEVARASAMFQPIGLSSKIRRIDLLSGASTVA